MRCPHVRVRESERFHVAMLSAKLHGRGHIHGDSPLAYSSRTLFITHTSCVQHGRENEAVLYLESERLPSGAAFSFSDRKKRCIDSSQHPDHKDAVRLENSWSSISNSKRPKYASFINSMFVYECVITVRRMHWRYTFSPLHTGPGTYFSRITLRTYVDTLCGHGHM